MRVKDIEPLLDEIRIGSITIGNRFVRSATHEWLAEPDGKPSRAIAEIYENLAKNNIGLIISGYSFVSPCGRSSSNQQGIYDDRFIEDYASLVRMINKYDAKFFIQIVHGGRQALVTEDCSKILAPSPVRLPESNECPEQMSVDDIEKVILDFANAVDRARRAGVNGVQLHCAHGFLLSNFLSPYTNRREDDWGGDTERRSRIVTEILRIAKKDDDNFPIAAKMNAWDGIDGGINLREAVKIAEILNSEGIDAIEVSGGSEDARTEITCTPDILAEGDEAYFREYSRAIKKNVDCPVILVGGLRSLGVMRRMISEEYADMISLSRPLIREPDLVSKFIKGNSNRATCISCNNCFDETGIKCNQEERR